MSYLDHNSFKMLLISRLGGPSAFSWFYGTTTSDLSLTFPHCMNILTSANEICLTATP